MSIIAVLPIILELWKLINGSEFMWRFAILVHKKRRGFISSSFLLIITDYQLRILLKS